VDAALFAAKRLHLNLVSSQPFKDGDMEGALKSAFLYTDKEYIERSAQTGLKSGCTAVVCLRETSDLESKLYFAWAGDSQAILVRDGAPLDLTPAHKPECEQERERIKAAGGYVEKLDVWRVDGTLGVSRAIGDPDYKPYVTAEPEIVSLVIQPQDDFIILACDGLWDQISPDDATSIVYELLATKTVDEAGNPLTPDSIAKAVSDALVEGAQREGSQDNITAIVVFLKDIKSMIPTTQVPPAPVLEKVNESPLKSNPASISLATYTTEGSIDSTSELEATEQTWSFLDSNTLTDPAVKRRKSNGEAIAAQDISRFDDEPYSCIPDSSLEMIQNPIGMDSTQVTPVIEKVPDSPVQTNAPSLASYTTQGVVDSILKMEAVDQFSDELDRATPASTDSTENRPDSVVRLESDDEVIEQRKDSQDNFTAIIDTNSSTQDTALASPVNGSPVKMNPVSNPFETFSSTHVMDPNAELEAAEQSWSFLDTSTFVDPTADKRRMSNGNAVAAQDISRFDSSLSSQEKTVIEVLDSAQDTFPPVLENIPDSPLKSTDDSFSLATYTEGVISPVNMEPVQESVDEFDQVDKQATCLVDQFSDEPAIPTPDTPATPVEKVPESPVLSKVPSLESYTTQVVDHFSEELATPASTDSTEDRRDSVVRLETEDDLIDQKVDPHDNFTAIIDTDSFTQGSPLTSPPVNGSPVKMSPASDPLEAFSFTHVMEQSIEQEAVEQDGSQDDMNAGNDVKSIPQTLDEPEPLLSFENDSSSIELATETKQEIISPPEVKSIEPSSLDDDAPTPTIESFENQPDSGAVSDEGVERDGSHDNITAIIDTKSISNTQTASPVQSPVEVATPVAEESPAVLSPMNGTPVGIVLPSRIDTLERKPSLTESIIKPTQEVEAAVQPSSKSTEGKAKVTSPTEPKANATTNGVAKKPTSPLKTSATRPATLATKTTTAVRSATTTTRPATSSATSAKATVRPTSVTRTTISVSNRTKSAVTSNTTKTSEKTTPTEPSKVNGVNSVDKKPAVSRVTGVSSRLYPGPKPKTETPKNESATASTSTTTTKTSTFTLRSRPATLVTKSSSASRPTSTTALRPLTTSTRTASEKPASTRAPVVRGKSAVPLTSSGKTESKENGVTSPKKSTTTLRSRPVSLAPKSTVAARPATTASTRPTSATRASIRGKSAAPLTSSLICARTPDLGRTTPTPTESIENRGPNGVSCLFARIPAPLKPLSSPSASTNALPHV